MRVQKTSDRMDEDNSVSTSDSIQLEYMNPKDQNGQVSKAADTTSPNITSPTHQQHAVNEVLALNQPASNNVVNIQLNYDIDQTLDPESWDGDFHAISLHGSIEHLVLDAKNIKDSLTRIQKYILGKSINDDKANSVKDLKGIDKVAWKFISAIYKSHWDGLYIDDSRTSFRNKVKSKFNPNINKTPVNGKGKETVKASYVSPLPPLIPAKLSKEVNEISKFFKKNPNQPQNKSYA